MPKDDTQPDNNELPIDNESAPTPDEPTESDELDRVPAPEEPPEPTAADEPAAPEQPSHDDPPKELDNAPDELTTGEIDNLLDAVEHSGAEAGHDFNPTARLLPPGKVYLLPLPDMVLFPGHFLPLHIEEADQIKTVDEAYRRAAQQLAVVPRKMKKTHDGQAVAGTLRAVGCMAHIARMRKLPDGSIQMLVQGQERVRVTSSAAEVAPATAEVVLAPVETPRTDIITAMVRMCKQSFARLAELNPQTNGEIVEAVEGIDSPLELAYLLASIVRMDPDERYAVLASDNLVEKLQVLLRVLSHEVELMELGSRIQKAAAGEMDKAQREFFLRQQLKAIRKELGEDVDDQGGVDELAERLDEANLPEEADKATRRELRRLRQIPEASPEHNVIQSYLELVLDLPWHTETPDNLDLKRAERILNQDHYGLEKVKERILEYLAVRSLKPDIKGPILCFVGPPGVGKTSLGHSIARALGRKFIRQSLGGMHDEAEIRGHRRTYVGAMPGRIIENLRRAGTCNPVFMLDEIDKVSASYQGDPSSALLEVLDPAQNNNFRDNYLDLPFDLSQVLFIATANQLGPVQPALLDRLEVIELEGYTENEKVEIARRYLIPRQTTENGLTRDQFKLGKPALRKIIAAYTHESGVRNLERTIGTLARKTARKVATGDEEITPIKPQDLVSLLGPEMFHSEVAARTARPGVATGLSVTNAGGEILFVETLRMPGKGALQLTGQLGDVMKESAEAAFSYLRANAARFGVEPTALTDFDYHLHVPAGAIPKDGPSAGITMATALLSAMLGRAADKNTAMTGEITLTGEVLPIGGLKSKTLAALRAGIKRVLLPADNRANMDELPQEVKDKIELVTVERVDEVFAAALGATPVQSSDTPAASGETDAKNS